MPTFGVDEPSQEDQSQHSSRDVETSDPFPPDDSEKYKSFYCQVIVVQVTRYLKTWIPPEAFSYTSTTSKSEMVPPSACMQHLLPTRASFQAVSSKMNKVVSNTFFWFLVCWMSTKTLALCPLPRRYQQPLAKQAQQWPLKVHHTEPKDPKRLATHPSSWVAAATATGTGATTVPLSAHASIIMQTTQLLSETPTLPVEIKPNLLLLQLLDLLGCTHPWDPWVVPLILGTGLVGFFFLGWGIVGSFLTTKSFPPKATTETELLQRRLLTS